MHVRIWAHPVALTGDATVSNHPPRGWARLKISRLRLREKDARKERDLVYRKGYQTQVDGIVKHLVCSYE